jgi:hypothetical protein
MTPALARYEGKEAHVVLICGEAFDVYKNDLYTVHRRHVRDREGWPAMVHLSIRRNDREPCRDWRHLQQIKNELVGPEHEGVELYPAEDRKVDTANQFHLWVLAMPLARFPFGYHDRLVIGPDECPVPGAVQRPFPEGGP